MKISEKIRHLRASAGMTQLDFAKIAGVSDKAVSTWEKGLKEPRMSSLAKICSHFSIDLNTFADESDDASAFPYSYVPGILPLPANKSYPLVGDIACGTPILAEENITEYIQFPGDLSADFCLRCKGDSMIEARIHDGDIVFIRQQPEVANGEIAAVQIAEEAATLKRVYRAGDTLTLMAANSTYPPMVYSGEQLASVRILGKAVNFLSAVK